MFNIRVYGLLVNKQHEVLLSRERYRDYEFTKFPGGGLEYGEGTLDTLKREFEEELGIKPFNFRHFYTTDFFQRSIMGDDQILSIYYLVDIADHDTVPELSDTGNLYFYPINETLVAQVTLPIDIVVAKMLLATIKP